MKDRGIDTHLRNLKLAQGIYEVLYNDTPLQYGPADATEKCMPCGKWVIHGGKSISNTPVGGLPPMQVDGANK